MISHKFLKGALCALSLALMPAATILTPTAYAAPPPVEHYAQLRDIQDAAISPDGKMIAIVMEHEGGYAMQTYAVDNIEGGALAGAVFPDQGQPRWIKWANNNRILVSIQTTAKISNSTPALFTNIVTATRNLDDMDLLIKQKRKQSVGSRLGSGSGFRQFNDYVIDWLPNDPEHILMGFSERDQFHTDVMRVNVDNGSTSSLYRGGADTQYWYTDLNGEVRVGQGRRDRDGEWELRIKLPGESNFSDSKNFPGLTGSSDVIGFLSDPNEMVVRRYNGKNTLGLSVYNLQEQRFTREVFSHPEYDVRGLELSADGSKVIGANYVTDHEEVEFFDAQAKARISRIQTQLPNYQIRYLDESSDGSRVLFWAVSADTPDALLLWNDKTGEYKFIGNVYPNVNNDNSAYVQSVSYSARDGEKIPAFVTIPAKAMEAGEIKNLPYIVLPHGGPFARDAASFDWMAQLFASRGYGVLQMNFRGSTGYGRKFSDAGRDNWVVMQDDVEDGTRWLIEKGYADPNRICILGWSYGGYAALMGAVKNGDLYQCAGSIAGVTDLNNLVNDMKDYRFGDFTSRSFVLRGFDEKRDLRENSPQQRANEINIPVFLAHGTYDIQVHYDQFTRMEKALKRADKDVTTVSVEDGDHSLTTNGNERVRVFKALDNFMIENLGESEWSQ